MKQIKITEQDCIGELKDVPVLIVKRMVECQVEQGNPADVTIFQKNIIANVYEGGFNWDSTKEGLDYWDETLRFKKFNEFFKKYYSVNKAIFNHVRFTAKLAKKYGFERNNLNRTYNKDITKDLFFEFNAITKKLFLQGDIFYGSNIFEIPCYLDRIEAIYFAFTGKQLKKKETKS